MPGLIKKKIFYLFLLSSAIGVLREQAFHIPILLLLHELHFYLQFHQLWVFWSGSCHECVSFALAKIQLLLVWHGSHPCNEEFRFYISLLDCNFFESDWFIIQQYIVILVGTANLPNFRPWNDLLFIFVLFLKLLFFICQHMTAFNDLEK